MKPRFLGVLAATLLGCAQASHPSTAPTSAREPQNVQVAAVHELLQARTDEVVGTVRARNVTAISPSVMGHVRSVRVTLGSRVRPGDVLVQLAAEEIDAKASQANATFEQANIELNRARQLRASEIIPAAQFDLVEARFRVAQAALEEAKVVRSYTTLRAPFAGVVTAKQCEVGDLAVPGKPLLVLESPNALRLEAAVPEVSAQRLHGGDVLPVKIDSLAEPVTAVVSELSPAADPLSRTVLVKLDLPKLAALRPGMFGRLQVPAGEARTLVVAAPAVLKRGQIELVYVVKAAHAQLRIVRTGRSFDGSTEILAGVDPGEQVVVTQPEQLDDGQAVQVQL